MLVVPLGIWRPYFTSTAMLVADYPTDPEDAAAKKDKKRDREPVHENSVAR